MTWGPRRPLVWIAAAATIGAAVGATLYGRDGDGPGAMLLWILAALLAACTAYGSLLNPRLTADESGVVIRMFSGNQAVSWKDLETQVKITRRLGRDTRTLELEFPSGGEKRLVVLGRLELGADPDDVLAELRRLRTG